MSTLFRSLLVVLAVAWTGSASAALMSPVAVDGLEWLQPLDFLGYSWNEISATCDATSGLCNGSLGGNDVTGWTWASIYDVGELYAALTPHPGGISNYESIPPESVAWATDFFGLFSITNQIFTPVEAVGVLGVTSTLAPTGGAYYGAVSILVGFGGFQSQAITNDTVLLNDTWAGGGWFYRASEVAVPATIPLLGLGLAALSLSRRKRKLHS